MLTLLGAGQGQTNSVDLDYQAVLNTASTLGYTLPSVEQRVKQNTLLLALKSSGIWDKLDIFYVFANNGSSGFATLNWKAPTLRQCTLVSTPNFITNQGFQGTGTSYISTNFNPTTGTNKYLQNDASRYIYLHTDGISTNVSFDGILTNTRNSIFRGSGTTHRINQGANNFLNGAFTYTGTKEMKSIHRTSSANVEAFNGVVQGSRTATSAAMESSFQTILRGTSPTVFATHTISMYAMGGNLVTENTNFVNAFNTYITSL